VSNEEMREAWEYTWSEEVNEWRDEMEDRYGD